MFQGLCSMWENQSVQSGGRAPVGMLKDSDKKLGTCRVLCGPLNLEELKSAKK